MDDGIIRSVPLDRSGPRRDWFGQLQIDDVPTVVWKYGTGHEVPAGAVYLCTQVEEVAIHDGGSTPRPACVQRFVWHYFRLPAESTPVERAV